MTVPNQNNDVLSRREMQIARAYCTGATYRDIAEQLFIAPSTVKTHLRTIYRKLGVANKVGLIQALPDPTRQDPPENAGTAARTSGGTGFRIAPNPVIAVLPFANLSTDPDQEFFADGLSEDIITRLSCLRGAVVISRTSSFVFKGQSKTAKEIGTDLGARYLVEGSVRISDQQGRIVVKLIDAANDTTLWTNRFDQKLSDVFALQDQITHEVVEALQIKLTDGAMVGDLGGTRDFVAWELFHQGALAHLRYTPHDSLVARDFFARAMARDQNFVDAKVFFAWTYWQRARSGFAKDPKRGFTEARRLLDELKETGPASSSLIHLETATLLMERQFEDALAAADRAAAAGPSKLFGYTPAALAYLYCGRYRDAVDLFREGTLKIPYTPTDTIYNLSTIFRLMGNHRRAVELAEEYIRRVPDDLYGDLSLAIAYQLVGEPGKSEETIGRLLERYPHYRIRDYATHEPFRDQSVLDQTLQILRTSGLPD